LISRIDFGGIIFDKSGDVAGVHEFFNGLLLVFEEMFAMFVGVGVEMEYEEGNKEYGEVLHLFRCKSNYSIRLVR